MTTALETVAGESITGGLTLTVREARLLCPGIRHVVLADPAGRTLPSFTPGSHIAVTWAEGSAEFLLAHRPLDRAGPLRDLGPARRERPRGFGAGSTTSSRISASV